MSKFIGVGGVTDAQGKSALLQPPAGKALRVTTRYTRVYAAGSYSDPQAPNARAAST